VISISTSYLFYGQVRELHRYKKDTYKKTEIGNQQ
jgi:hypothetical protein